MVIGLRTVIFATAITSATTLLATTPSSADNTTTAPCTPNAPTTWGASQSPNNTTTPTDESPVSRARDLLARAKLLDEAATSDEKSAADIATRLPTLRTTAKAARDRADRASGDDREPLVSRAEDLESDLTVSEAEIAAKRRTAADNRRVARDLRARAVKIVRDAPTDTAAASSTAGSHCDPPFRFTTDGRKIYRIECLK